MTIKEVAEKYDISADTLRYYERVGMIPKVTRKANGIRDYQESDLGWVELALCMRSACLPVEVMIEYVKLYKEGDNTSPARLELLQEQIEVYNRQTPPGQHPTRINPKAIPDGRFRTFVIANAKNGMIKY